MGWTLTAALGESPAHVCLGQNGVDLPCSLYSTILRKELWFNFIVCARRVDSWRRGRYGVAQEGEYTAECLPCCPRCPSPKLFLNILSAGIIGAGEVKLHACA